MGAEVSAGYFRLLGVTPFLGRDFNARTLRPIATRSCSATDSGCAGSAAIRQWSDEGFRSLENRTPLPE
jgi:hypothetical protein